MDIGHLRHSGEAPRDAVPIEGAGSIYRTEKA